MKEEKNKLNYHSVVAKCSTCGKEYTLNSTVSEIRIDTCSNCHPFYTGNLSSTSVAGRIDKFNRKYTKKTN